MTVRLTSRSSRQGVRRTRPRTVLGWSLAVLVGTSLALSTPAAAAPPAPHLGMRPVVTRAPSHRLDLATARRTATASTRTATQRSVPRAVAAGRAPLVARDPDASSGDLWVYSNDGSATGNPWLSRYLTGDQWRFADLLLVGDINGDRRADVVARDPSTGGGTLWIYPNNGATTGNPWTTRYQAGTGWNFANTLMLSDVTGDGRADLVARDPSVDQGTLWVYPNNGSTTANPFPSRFWAGTGWNLADALMLGDVTGDGHPEMVARDDGGNLWIYPNNGATTSNPWTTSRYFAGNGWNLADTLMLGDVNGDGHPDLVARDGTGALWIYPGNGATTTNPWTTSRYSAGTGWGFADTMLLGDVNGDGHPDVLARPGGDLWIYPNNGAKSDPWATGRISAGTGWGFADTLLLGDVNGDGHPDLLARNPVLDNGTLWMYPGNGSTTANPWTAAPTWLGNGWNIATATALGDLTGDGRPDLLIRDGSGNLWVYPNSGARSGNPFTVSRIWAGTGWNTATALALGDVNGDGVPDLIDQEQDGSMWIYLTGSSGPPMRVDGDWSSTNKIMVGDVYGTGHADLVIRDTSGKLWIYPNDGSMPGNPWTSRQPAGDWPYASILLL